MVQEPERRVDHVSGARGDLRAATKTGEIVADVAVVLLDRGGQILASEQLLRRNQPVEAFPVVGQEDTALDADLVEESAAGRIITPTQLPGQGSPCHRCQSACNRDPGSASKKDPPTVAFGRGSPVRGFHPTNAEVSSPPL